MLPDNPSSASIGRRVDQALRRERLRTTAVISGIALVCMGGLVALLPFGPSLFNSIAIPKLDPNAGLAVLQSLPSGKSRYIGLALALLGGALLLLSVFLVVRDPVHDANRNV